MMSFVIMMATYFIYAFIFAGIFFHGLGAQQLSRVALIYPQRSDVTVDAATDMTLGCRGTEPMTWTFNDDFNGPHFNTSQKSITNIYNDKELDYKYETILTLFNVSGVNVGFYYCHGTEVNLDTPRRSGKIYVFVHDDNHLSVITSKEGTFIDGRWRRIVPCRPTAPDINITVTCADVLGELVMSVNPDNYTAVLRSENKDLIQFNSYYGFIAEHEYLKRSWKNCSCDFIRNNRMSTLKLFSVFRIVSYEHYLFIAGQAAYTANVGDDIKLQCIVLFDQYFPYDKHWPYWDFPVTGKKRKEYLQIIKLQIYIVIINTITLNNITNEDEGDYKCQMNAQLRLSSTSKYIYVNDKNNNHSAPQIYFPNGGEIQVNPGANITLRCTGTRPVTWAKPIDNRLSYQIEYISNVSGRYETYLHLMEVSYRNTFFYYCHENDSLTNHLFKSDRTYIFVKDTQILNKPYKGYPTTFPYANVTVPCLSTSRDVNVSLSMRYQARDAYSNSFDPEQEFNPVIYAYDPRHGFTIQAPGFGIATATCIFTTETVRRTLDIQFYIPDYKESEPFITGPDDDLVLVGQTLELCCTALVYHNVSDDALHWTSPNHFTSSEVIEERKLINIFGGKILINKLILYDVKNENAGRYSCNLTSNDATATKAISVYGNVIY